MAASEHLNPAQFPGQHRGVMLSMSNEDVAEHLQRGGVPALHEEISRRVLTGDQGSPGRHWTSDRATAEKFSHRYMTGPHTRVDDWQTHIPVMMHADIDPAHVEHNPDEHTRAMVGHQGRQEHETLLKPGSPVKVSHVEAALPRGDWEHTWHETTNLPDEDAMIKSWQKVPHTWQKL